MLCSLHLNLLMAAPGLIAGIAERLQGAVSATRLAGDANLAAVVDHLVRESDPVVLGNDFHQILFDWNRLGFFRKLETPGEPEYMRIHHHADGFAEGHAQYYVCRLAGYA